MSGPHRRWEVMAAIAEQRVVAIVRARDAPSAEATARALLGAGVRAVEVSLTTPGALDVIAILAEAAPDGAFVGAGTVLDPESARLAVLAGARFLVAPNLPDGVVATGHRYGAAAIPGVATPGEVVRALEQGADAIKLFPASLFTPAAMRDLLEALPQAPIVPTGGITLDDAPAWIEAGAVAVGLGGALSRGSAREVGERANRVLDALAAAAGRS